MVFVDSCFLKETGKVLEEEKELADLNTYRSFWNKVWESQGLNAGGRKKLWELNAGMRYSIFLSPDHDANGLVETKILQAPDDADSITLKTAGKMKAGIELSMTELNKLLPLWPGETVLDAGRLQAVTNTIFAKNLATEMICDIRMKGRQGTRGLVWMIPTFRLQELVLNRVTGTNEAGQVTACTEEKARFPVPAGVRVLGLKSKD